MKTTQIRQGVFETNSSSTHSICIAKDATLTIPKSLAFCFGEFGWECDTLSSVGVKASYLYTGLTQCDRQEDIDKIAAILSSKGISVAFEEPVYKTSSWKNSDGDIVEHRYCDNGGYVDHANDLGDFLNAILADEDKLMSYLFSDLSFIITGNDNDDQDVDIQVSYPHDEYYKGN